MIGTVPDLWQRLTTACTTAGCPPGQPTAAGLATLAQLGFSPRVYSVLVFAALLAVPGVIVVLMGLLLWKKPGDRTVAALAFGGMACSLLGAIGEAAAARPWLGPLEGAFWLISGAGLTLGLLSFPDGRFVPSWGRWLAYPLLLAASLFWVPGWGKAATGTAFVLVFPSALVVLSCRYRRAAEAQERQQLKWVLYSLGVLAVLSLVNPLADLVLPASWLRPGAPGELSFILLNTAGILLFWLCLALSVYRYRLFDIDLVIRRTLLYGGLSVAVSAGYLLPVLGLPHLLRSLGGPLFWLVAALPVAFTLRPLHRFFARWAARAVPAAAEKPLLAPHPSSARSGWHRVLWWGYGVVVLGLVVVGVPAVLELRMLPCTGELCDVQGRLTAQRLAALGAAGVSPTVYAYWSVCTQLLVPLCGFALFALTLWRRPGNRAAHLLALGVLSCNALYPGSLTALAGTYPWAGWVDAALLFVTAAALLPALFAFPDGRFFPRWATLLLAPNTLVALLLGLAVSPLSLDLTPFFPTLGVWNLLIAAAAVTALAVRYRTALTPQTRQQVWWVLVGVFVATPLGLLLDAAVAAFGDRPRLYLLLETAATLNILFFLTCLAVAMLFHQLFDIGMVLRRVLVYGGLTLGVGALYGLLVALAGLLSLGSDNLLVSLLATGTVALLFGPLRARLQRGVNRLLYGQRSEPYRVVAALTERLGGLLEPAQVFPVTVETVATALKLPYADIVLGLEPRTVARYGEPGAHTERFVLAYANEALGLLSVSPRPGESHLSRADRLLLSDLSRQVSAAAHAYLLAADLERSRLRLVSAREEARRKLGSDLHDSVGQQLAGLLRRAETASNLLLNDPARAQTLLAELAAQSRATSAQVRSLAHQLHPPELELLGLVGALRERLDQRLGETEPNLAAEPLRVTLRAAELPQLPAAVEVAAYYIVQEALHNVYKHARARHCWVRLEQLQGATLGVSAVTTFAAPVLDLEVADDGCGLAAENRDGLGFHTMRERAAELGGSCAVEARPGGGTRVVVQLPCPEL